MQRQLQNRLQSEIDAVQAIPLLRKIGQNYASENMKLDHSI
jgi:hypothetical protein